VPRGAANAVAATELDVTLDPLRHLRPLDVGPESIERQAGGLRARGQSVVLQWPGPAHELLVHRPEPPLEVSGLSGPRGRLGVRMLSDDREVPEGEADLIALLTEQSLEPRLIATAERALVVAVFDQHRRGRFRADRVVLIAEQRARRVHRRPKPMRCPAPANRGSRPGSASR